MCFFFIVLLGAETFHVNTAQAFVTQQPPNQSGNQGIRAMAPTGPPNQASTPPNTELKVQQITQPASMNIVSPRLCNVIIIIDDVFDDNFKVILPNI